MFLIPNPNDIKIFMVDDIPLVVTENSFIVLKHPTFPPQAHIDTIITKYQLNCFASDPCT